ncbi:FG-GAP-like repeat-containing protein [Prosthecochloris vibrioformis]
MQIELDAELRPKAYMSSIHLENAQYRTPIDEDITFQDDHIIVYPAEGGHPTYFTCNPAETDTGWGGTDVHGCSDANWELEPDNYKLIVVEDESPEYYWMASDIRWGLDAQDHSGEREYAPSSPGVNPDGRFSNPEEWINPKIAKEISSLNGADNYLAFDNGLDRKYGGEGDDTLYGYEMNDTLIGGPGADSVRGGDDDDVLYGDSGIDELYGEEGNDTLYGGSGVDSLYGNDGDDVLIGGGGMDYLIGAAGSDTFIGVAGDGFVDGGEGFDIIDCTTLNRLCVIYLSEIYNVEAIYGSSYNDDLNGDNSDNVLVGNSGNDFIIGNDGDDYIYGGMQYSAYVDPEDDDDLQGGNGNDAIKGGHGDDTLKGGLHNDILEGESGDDELHGESGNDYLDGGLGQDLLYGGPDDDTLVYDSSDLFISGGYVDRDGGGYDTLKFISSYSLNGEYLANIDRINAFDFTDPDSQELFNVSLQTIEDITDPDITLVVVGGQEDTVQLDAGIWSLDPNHWSLSRYEGKEFRKYIPVGDEAENPTARLYVQTQIQDGCEPAGNQPPTGEVLIDGLRDGEAWVGDVLQADTSTLVDPDGLGTLHYQWYADSAKIAGAVGSSFTVTEAELGKQLRLYVNYVDGAGKYQIKASDLTPEVKSEDGIEVPPLNHLPVGAAVITGSAIEESVLTVDTSTLKDADGLGTFSYQWLVDGAVISGATDATFTLVNEHIGSTVSVTVSYTDGNGTLETLRSASTEPVKPIYPGNDYFTHEPGNTHLNAGDGDDVLIVHHAGSVEFSELADIYSNFELLDLSDGDVQRVLNIGADDVRRLTDNRNVLEIWGKSDDAITFTNDDGWHIIDDAATLPGYSFTTFRHYLDLSGQVNVYVEDVQTSGDPGSGDPGSGTGSMIYYDEFNGSTIGNPYGITYVETPQGQGVLFSRENESRIQYGFNSQIPKEGTLEFVINVDSGYRYRNYTLEENRDNALIFTTDIQSGDVTWPGSTWLYVHDNGKIDFHIAGAKYEAGGQSQYHLIAEDTAFRFDEWHTIGVSYGSEGRYIMLDGEIVASDTTQTQQLGRGGTHSSPVDIPTIGESVSGFWRDDQWEGSFNGTLESFRVSNGQQDWYLSATTPGNEGPTGTVAITGLAEQGETLSADISTLADEDGLGTLSYQWYAGDGAIGGATASTYTLTQAEVGKEIKVEVCYTDDEGMAESVTSSATAAVAKVNDEPTGSVTIDGTVTEGQTLTANTSTLADEDGLGTLSYQWYAGDGAIGGATASTYTLTQAEVGKEIKVEVCYTDDEGMAESVTSSATASVANVNDAPTGSVTTSGTVAEDEELTAVTTTLADEDGLGTLSYQWYADGDAISGATSSTYTLTATEVGKAMTVEVSYTDGYGTEENVSSVSTDEVEPGNHAPEVSIPALLSFADKVDYATGVALVSVTSADVDGDGYADMLAATRNSDTVSVLLNNGEGTFAPKVDYATGDNPHSVTSADVDGDGYADMLVANYGSDTVSVLLNNGDGTFAAKVDYATGDGPWSVTSADVDGDGYADMLVANLYSDTVSVLLNNGEGTFAPKVDYATGDNPYSVTSADVDGDGYADMLVANNGSDTVSVLLNNGKGTFVAKVDYATGDGPWSVTSADVDDDGDADMLVANFSSHTVSVLKNLTPPAETVALEQTAVPVSSGILISDPDGDASWHGGSLQVQISTSAEAGDTLSLPGENPGDGGIWFNAGALQLMTGDVQIGTGDAGGMVSGDNTWTLVFNENASNALVQEVARAIQFTHTGDAPSNALREVRFTVMDGEGEAVTVEQSLRVENVNDEPTGSVTISGTVAEDEELTAVTTTLADEDGLGTLSYQWYADSVQISGATGESYTLTEAEFDKVITVAVSYTDGYGTVEQLESVATEAVKPAGSDVEGSVTFWKTGASLEGVEVRAQSALQESDGGTAVMIRELLEHEDGSRTMEVWAKSDESIESLQLEFGLSTGATVVWEDAADLPSGWTSLANTENDGEFILGGMGLTGITAGEYLLGTMRVSAPDDPDRFELSLESGALGNASSDLFDLVSVRSSTQADGGYMLEEVPGGEYELDATKASDSSLTGAVKATDALAALKLAVGMNPNADGDVSNYQYLAADVNGDGKVMATDALAILKMAVGLSDAAEHEWLFFGEEVDDVAMSRNEVVWSDAPVAIEDDMLIDLVGVVKGDVDGSWMPSV